MSDNEGQGGGGGAGEIVGDSSGSGGAENQHQPQRSHSALDSEDAPSPTSDSTQWPSAPSSPNSQDNGMTRLQDILDRALRDPFSSHPEVAAHLKSNVGMYCELAAEKIYEADVLLVVTGAGFSADSGLATYLDVADIDAYRSKGWRYRDLCRPPAFGDFDDLNGGGNGEGTMGEESDVVAGDGENDESKRQDSNTMEPYRIEGRDGFVNEKGSESNSYQEELHPERQSDEDDIHHPQYFYGFWGQCSNDYRRVRPHDGYDIIARWGRDKNFLPGPGDDAINERTGSEAAQDIRRITQMLELGDDGSEESSHDSGSFFRFKEDDEDEPYYVSPTERAGAFFVFTSNVDAHSFDVFKSHEIRECHGNVEMWQCHNFACGTNATVMHGGSLDGSDCNGDNDRNIGDKTEQEEKWQRRLWRLPVDHHFTVGRNTMQAPREKTTMDTESMESASPASKRRKSSMTEREDENNDTATALGGLMEDTLQHHLARGAEQSQQCETDALDSNTEVNAPAHVGDVHGKPRLFPLRHMHPPTGAATNGEMDGGAQNYYLPIAANENWPRCPRCQEAARPAVLMFDDLDWVYNLKQEQRWQRWTQSLLKLCKWRGRGVEGVDNESVSTASNDDMSEKGWEDVSESSTEKKTDPIVDTTSPAAAEKREGVAAEQSTAAKTDQAVGVTMPTEPQDAAEKEDTDNPKPPLKVAILEIGCGYNVPTCRVIAERLTGELTVRGGDATLIRINPTHPESDDHGAEDCIVSIMEKGLAALKLIDDCYRELSAKAYGAKTCRE